MAIIMLRKEGVDTTKKMLDMQVGEREGGGPKKIRQLKGRHETMQYDRRRGRKLKYVAHDDKDPLLNREGL